MGDGDLRRCAHGECRTPTLRMWREPTRAVAEEDGESEGPRLTRGVHCRPYCWRRKTNKGGGGESQQWHWHCCWSAEEHDTEEEDRLLSGCKRVVVDGGGDCWRLLLRQWRVPEHWVRNSPFHWCCHGSPRLLLLLLLIREYYCSGGGGGALDEEEDFPSSEAFYSRRCCCGYFRLPLRLGPLHCCTGGTNEKEEVVGSVDTHNVRDDEEEDTRDTNDGEDGSCCGYCAVDRDGGAEEEDAVDRKNDAHWCGVVVDNKVLPRMPLPHDDDDDVAAHEEAEDCTRMTDCCGGTKTKDGGGAVVPAAGLAPNCCCSWWCGSFRFLVFGVPRVLCGECVP